MPLGKKIATGRGMKLDYIHNTAQKLTPNEPKTYMWDINLIGENIGSTLHDIDMKGAPE